MISNGEIDHPFVQDFDDSVAFGILVRRLFAGEASAY